MQTVPPFNPFSLFFPLGFIAFWVTISLFICYLAGWFRLMKRYPDQIEVPEEKFSVRSCSMGPGVNFRGIISLELCHSGIRVKLWRLFGPFCKPFFVPWNELSVERRDGFLGKRAIFRFGSPQVGNLTVGSFVADQIARRLGSRWPETGTFDPESTHDSFLAVAKLSALGALVGMTFFIVVPRMAAPPPGRPPLIVAILFPLIVFILIGIYEYVSRRKHSK